MLRKISTVLLVTGTLAASIVSASTQPYSQHYGGNCQRGLRGPASPCDGYGPARGHVGHGHRGGHVSGYSFGYSFNAWEYHRRTTTTYGASVAPVYAVGDICPMSAPYVGQTGYVWADGRCHHLPPQ